MPKGQERQREKKKAKKEKGTKQPSAYASAYGKQQPTHLTETPPGKKQ